MNEKEVLINHNLDELREFIEELESVVRDWSISSGSRTKAAQSIEKSIEIKRKQIVDMILN